MAKMTEKVAFGIQNMFSRASRERCMRKLKEVSSPQFGRSPTANAAVLVPLCRVDDVISILYTVRATHLRSNSGQISFPGGKSDNSEGAIQTALRETEEEIGLAPAKIDVWGTGPPVPGRNNTLKITPVIGSIACLTEDDLNINPKEVSECFTVPVEILCDPKNQFHTQFKNGWVLPVFVAEKYKIWGMTALITHTFLNCILNKHIYKNEWMRKKIVYNFQKDHII